MLLALKNEGHSIHFIYTGSKHDVDSQAMAAAWDALYLSEQENVTVLKRVAKAVKKILHVDTEWLDHFVWKLKIPFIAKLFKPYLIDDWYSDVIDQKINDLLQTNHYDVVIAEYVFLSKALTRFGSQTLKVLDTHDVFANRHLMYLKQGKIPHYFFTTPDQELTGISRADVVIAIQKEEYNYFKHACDKPVLLIGHICHPYQLPINTINNTVNLMFVGSSSAPNLGALDFLCGQINFYLKKKNINFTCNIVGNIKAVMAGEDRGFHFVGPVDDLETYYRKADIVVNPVQIGTGLNIKTIEALSYGKPLVTTSVGAQGLDEGKNSAFLVADRAEQFAEQVELLISDSSFYREIAENAYLFALEYNRKVMGTLTSLVKNTHENIQSCSDR